MTYEAAPATTMLETFCGICGRPLVACKSVEVEIGPDCRKKVYAIDIDINTSRATIKAADKLINEAAKVATTAARQIEISEELVALGFDNVAAKIGGRWTKRAAKALAKRIKAAKVVIENNWIGPVNKCRVETVSVKTPYCPDFVADLKAAVHYQDRKWNRDAKVWEVATSARRELWKVIKDHFAGEEGHGPKGFFTVPG